MSVWLTRLQEIQLEQHTQYSKHQNFMSLFVQKKKNFYAAKYRFRASTSVRTYPKILMREKERREYLAKSYQAAYPNQRHCESSHQAYPNQKAWNLCVICMQ
jgi:hypothetical protein